MSSWAEQPAVHRESEPLTLLASHAHTCLLPVEVFPPFDIWTLGSSSLALSLVVHINNGRVKCDEFREIRFPVLLLRALE